MRCFDGREKCRKLGDRMRAWSRLQPVFRLRAGPRCHHEATIMHSLELIKPDGRSLTLYSSQPIAPDIAAPSPFPEPQNANPHLRWHPLRGEWVAYAAYRQNRTYQPPPQYNPLAPTRDRLHPTEIPQGAYEIAVFDNRFPALALGAHDAPALTVPTLPAAGHCEVVVFTQDALPSLGALPLAIGFGEGSELRRPLGVAIIGGLLASQLLTLLTTPVVYVVMDKLRRRSPAERELGHHVDYVPTPDQP